jgi:hypothetical protein
LALVAVQDMRRHAKRAPQPLNLAIVGAKSGVGEQSMDVARAQLATHPGEIEQQVAALFAPPGAYEVVGKPVNQVVVDHVHPSRACVRSVVAPEQRLVAGANFGTALADEVALQVVEEDGVVILPPCQRAIDEQAYAVSQL